MRSERVNAGADNGTIGLDQAQLQEALHEVGRSVNKESLEEIFMQYDADGNGSVGFEEFKCAVRRRSKLEQWTASMPLGPLVASCFVPLLLRSYENEQCTAKTAESSTQEAGAKINMLNDPDPLSRIMKINDRDLSIVCIGLMDGFRELICERIMQLNESYNAIQTNLPKSDSSGSDVCKFAFSMQGGKTSDFYSGLGARVGTGPLLNTLHSVCFLLPWRRGEGGGVEPG